MLDKFIKDMQKAKEYVDTKNGQAINEMFASSREYRDSFPDGCNDIVLCLYTIFINIFITV